MTSLQRELNQIRAVQQHTVGQDRQEQSADDITTERVKPNWSSPTTHSRSVLCQDRQEQSADDITTERVEPNWSSPTTHSRSVLCQDRQEQSADDITTERVKPNWSSPTTHSRSSVKTDRNIVLMASLQRELNQIGAVQQHTVGPLSRQTGTIC